MPTLRTIGFLGCLGLIIAIVMSNAPAVAAVCGRGQVMSSGACVPLPMPSHAHINSLGNGWVCNFGYERSGEACGPVVVPRNASLGKNSDVWTCNRGYYEIRGICLPTEKTEQASTANTPLTSMRAAVERRLTIGHAALMVVLTIVVAGLAALLARREEPAVEAYVPAPHSFRPQITAIALADAWQSWGEKIDGLTGGPIAEGVQITQCPTCQTSYGAESVAVLRSENRGRCLGCGSRLMRRTAQMKFQTLLDSAGDAGSPLALPAR